MSGTRWGRSLRPIPLALLGLTLGLVMSSSALGAKVVGSITGYMNLENPVWAEAKDPEKKGYSFREMVPTVPAKYRKLYPHIPKEVCLALVAGAAQPKGEATLIRVGGGRTTPGTIVVTPGTKLVFKNTDPFTHRLHAVGVSTFSPNDTEKGGTREWTVPGAGTFEVRDELAPSLRMWIVSEPNTAAISYPTMSGEYQLSASEPGDYTVQAYFAGQKVGPAVPVKVDARDVKLAPITVGEPKKDGDK